MNEIPLMDRVKEALQNAKENGYDMGNLAPLQVAIDLFTYDSDLENEDICEISTIVHIIRLNTPTSAKRKVDEYT